MIILGVILIILGYLIPLSILSTVGYILLAIGLVLLLLSLFGVGVGGARVGPSGRRFYF